MHQESKEMFTSNAGLTIDPWVTENEPLRRNEEKIRVALVQTPLYLNPVATEI